MTTLYLAGPCTGLPDFNYPAFYSAAEQLRAVGYAVENPAENVVEGSAQWIDYMRMSLVQISRSDGIALLPGWDASKGARIEQGLGINLGLPTHNVARWIVQAELTRQLP